VEREQDQRGIAGVGEEGLPDGPSRESGPPDRKTSTRM